MKGREVKTKEKRKEEQEGVRTKQSRTEKSEEERRRSLAAKRKEEGEEKRSYEGRGAGTETMNIWMREVCWGVTELNQADFTNY